MDSPEWFPELQNPPRLLLGPGPSMVHPRVLRAMASPLVGHLDPYFLQIMETTQTLLRYVFGTENDLTIPISGTGSAAMESSLANVIEPGDPILICINGYFGQRLQDMAGRYGAQVRILEKPWGEVFEAAEVEQARTPQCESGERRQQTVFERRVEHAASLFPGPRQAPRPFCFTRHACGDAENSAVPQGLELTGEIDIGNNGY